MVSKEALWKLIRIFAPIMLGAVVIMALVLSMGLSRMIGMLKEIDPMLIIASAGLLAASALIKSLRWHLLIREIGIENRIPAIYSYFLCQTANEILPAGSGELIKIAVLRGRNGTHFMSFVPGAVLEASFDIALLLVLSVILATPFLDMYTMTLLLLAVIACMVILLKPSVLSGISDMLDRDLKPAYISRVSGYISSKLNEFITAMGLYSNNRKVMVSCALLTVLAWVVVEPLSQYILFLGLGIDISYISLLGAVAISWILGAISMLPGGVGSRDVAFALAMAISGMPFEIAFSVAMAYRLITYALFPALTIALYVLYRHYISKSIAGERKYFADGPGRSDIQ